MDATHLDIIIFLNQMEALITSLVMRVLKKIFSHINIYVYMKNEC